MCWWQAGATSTCWCALEGPEVLLNSDGGEPRVGSSPPLCPIIMNPPQHIKVISARYGQWVNCADDAQIWNALEAVCLAGSAQKQRIFLSVFGAAFLEQNLPRI